MLDAASLINTSLKRSTELVETFQPTLPYHVVLINCAEECYREMVWLGAGGSAEELERLNPRFWRNQLLLETGVEYDDCIREVLQAGIEKDDAS